ncbi:MAG: hypothetical protein ACOX6T_14750 [Myxococcales bacterium]|jgi:Cu/Ag efflux protein CusF
MWTKHLLAATAITLGLGAMVTMGWAEPARGTRPALRRADADALREGTGRVREIDRSKKKVTLEAKADPIVLDVDRTTTIFIDGRIATLEEIEPGMEVRAAWSARRGANRAQWIEVKNNSAPKPLPEAPKGR